MRKNYLDNIRWTVIILVLVFHVVSIFSSCGAVMSINAPGIPALDTIGYLIYPWFMCLLFVVSGICARISLEKRNGRAFVRDRARRLLLPFLSYIVFIGPLDSGLSIRVNGIPEAFASLPEWVVFCIRAVQGMGPSWFLLQLFVLSACLAGIRKADKKGRLSALGEKCTLPILLLLYFPVLASAQILYIAYTFRVGLYLLLFLMGYYVFSHEKIMRQLQKYCLPLLGTGLAAGAAQTVFSWGIPYQMTVNNPVVMLYTWLMLLGLLGAAGRWFNFRSRFTSYMSSHSFGIYYFHYVPMIYTTWFLTDRFTLPYLWNYILVFLFSLSAALLLGMGFGRIPVLNSLFGLKTDKISRQKAGIKEQS